MVERAVTKHLEILRVALRRGLRVRAIEGVSHAHAFDWFLRDAIHGRRSLDAGGLENCRHNIDHVVELRANAAQILDVAWPGDGHALPGATEE